MFKKILIAALAAGALASGAPVAQAAAVTADCGFNTIAQETVTGGQDTFTGGAYGFAVSDTPGASISVTCEVRVNGGAVASTPAGASGQASFTAGQVTYTATDTDTVTLCAVWSGSESGEVCGSTDTQQIPPEEVFALLEAIDAILIDLEKTLVDPLVCPVFITLNGLGVEVPGVLEFNEQGDVFLLGEAFWDCPPYDIFG